MLPIGWDRQGQTILDAKYGNADERVDAVGGTGSSGSAAAIASGACAVVTGGDRSDRVDGSLAGRAMTIGRAFGL